jgi:ADP-heptose:LPS heptosyltransferase
MKGIGDLVLALPAIENLKRHWPEASLQALVRNGRARDLAVRLFPLDHIHVWSFDWRREPLKGAGLMAALRKCRFDLVIDFMCDHSIASAAFSFSIGAPVTAGFSCARRKLFLNDLVIPDHTSHIADDWMRLIVSLGAPKVVSEPAIRLSRDETGFARNYLEREGVASGELLVSLHPGARDDLARLDKRWHWERYRDLCRVLVERRGARIVILGSEDERELCEKVAAGAKEGIVVACGKTSVVELLPLIGVSDLFIGNNSGPLHMASALGVPTVSFAGGVNLARWSPYGNPDRNRTMVPDPACDVSRCTECGMRGRKCLDAVGVEEVAGMAMSLLDQGLFRRRDLLFSGKDGIGAL